MIIDDTFQPLTILNSMVGQWPHGMTIPKDVCWSAFRVFDRMLGGSFSKVDKSHMERKIDVERIESELYCVLSSKAILVSEQSRHRKTTIAECCIQMMGTISVAEVSRKILKSSINSIKLLD